MVEHHFFLHNSRNVLDILRLTFADIDWQNQAMHALARAFQQTGIALF